MATIKSDINKDFIDNLPMGAIFNVTVTHERMIQGPEALEGFLDAHNAIVDSFNMDQPTMDISTFNYSQTVASGPAKYYVFAKNIGSLNPGTFNGAAQSGGTILSQPQQDKIVKVKEKLTDEEIIERYNQIMEKRANKEVKNNDDYEHLEI